MIFLYPVFIDRKRDKLLSISDRIFVFLEVDHDGEIYYQNHQPGKGSTSNIGANRAAGFPGTGTYDHQRDSRKAWSVGLDVYSK